MYLWSKYMCMSSLLQSGLRIWDKECFLSFSHKLTLLKWKNGLTDLPSQAKLLHLSELCTTLIWQLFT